MTALSAYLHPIWQSVALVTAAWGLRIRTANVLHEMFRVYLEAIAVTLLAIGWIHGLWRMASGPYSQVFRSWHAWVGTVTIGLFGIDAYLGIRLSPFSQWTSASRTVRDTEVRGLHVFCMAIALFLAITQVVLGLPLLP